MLLEFEIGQEDPNPSADLEPVLLVPGVEDGAAHSRYQENRIQIRVRPVIDGQDPSAAKAVAQHLSLSLVKGL